MQTSETSTSDTSRMSITSPGRLRSPPRHTTNTLRKSTHTPTLKSRKDNLRSRSSMENLATTPSLRTSSVGGASTLAKSTEMPTAHLASAEQSALVFEGHSDGRPRNAPLFVGVPTMVRVLLRDEAGDPVEPPVARHGAPEHVAALRTVSLPVASEAGVLEVRWVIDGPPRRTHIVEWQSHIRATARAEVIPAKPATLHIEARIGGQHVLGSPLTFDCVEPSIDDLKRLVQA
eukprot:TRINITY_DN3236_c0_g1_i4.p1 TRINITY_DN3236_c0_g1~~TRINITY_DN3236_c0_g1_i4.p1  ORF type:complete len:232 (-),score=133.36 TRINITY_DN3236_c0_g1_i4:73-768(-)